MKTFLKLIALFVGLIAINPANAVGSWNARETRTYTTSTTSDRDHGIMRGIYKTLFAPAVRALRIPATLVIGTAIITPPLLIAAWGFDWSGPSMMAEIPEGAPEMGARGVCLLYALCAVYQYYKALMGKE